MRQFESLISFAGMRVIKRLMVNCDTPRQYLNFILYSSSSGIVCDVALNVRVYSSA